MKTLGRRTDRRPGWALAALLCSFAGCVGSPGLEPPVHDDRGTPTVTPPGSGMAGDVAGNMASGGAGASGAAAGGSRAPVTSAGTGGFEQEPPLDAGVFDAGSDEDAGP